MVRGLINTAFAQESPEAASAQWRTVTDQLRERFPKLAAMMEEAETDVLAFMTFPKAHRTKIHSTNPLEWLLTRRSSAAPRSWVSGRFTRTCNQSVARMLQ